MQLLTKSVFLLSAFVIAGCEESSSAGIDTSYDDLVDQFVALGDTVDALETLDPTEVPTVGSASYSGVLVFEGPDDGLDTNFLAGDMSMTADFANSEVSGSAGNFVNADDEEYSGSLTVSNGTIFNDVVLEDFYTYSADIAGSLSGADNEVDVDGELGGDFFGDDAEYAGGVIEGTLDVNDGEETITLDEDNSGFLLEQ